MIPLGERGPFPKCTLDSLSKNYTQFLADGGHTKRAKQYQNVIAKAIFEIPINQVNKTLFH